MSPFWIFTGANDDGGSGGDNWNYKTC